MLANLKLLVCNPKVNLIITEKLFLTNRLVFSFCENCKTKILYLFFPPLHISRCTCHEFLTDFVCVCARTCARK
jgi:hypothetical protein